MTQGTQGPAIPPIDTSSCGESKGCLRLPAGCTTQCDHLVTWRQDGDDIQMELEAGTPGWIAVGFTKVQDMVLSFLVQLSIILNTFKAIMYSKLENICWSKLKYSLVASPYIYLLRCLNTVTNVYHQ